MDKIESILGSINPFKFVRDNRAWLQKWIDNRRMSINQTGMQYFYEPLSYKYESYEEKEKAAIEQQINIILVRAIFSRYSLAKDGNGNIETMSGFVEQVGRLPEESDNVRIVYYAGGEVNEYFLIIGDMGVKSLCRVEVLD